MSRPNSGLVPMVCLFGWFLSAFCSGAQGSSHATPNLAHSVFWKYSLGEGGY